MSIVFNWKTTVLGVSALVSVLAHWYATGVAPGASEISAVLVAFGLIAAKDA